MILRLMTMLLTRHKKFTIINSYMSQFVSVLQIFLWLSQKKGGQKKLINNLWLLQTGVIRMKEVYISRSVDVTHLCDI